MIIGLWTGHIMLNHRLTVLRKKSDPLCSLCEEERTLSPLTGRCATTMDRWRNHFGFTILRPCV